MEGCNAIYKEGAASLGGRSGDTKRAGAMLEGRRLGRGPDADSDARQAAFKKLEITRNGFIRFRL